VTDILQVLHGMSNLCQQARVINIGSNLQNAGALRSLLGQLMPFVAEIRLSCDSPWSTRLDDGSAAASNGVLDSFRLEVVSSVDACVSALKEKMRIFQKRVMRKTTTPIKAGPASPDISGQRSPALASPALSSGKPGFRADPQLSPSILPVLELPSNSTAQKGPSSRPPPPLAPFFCSPKMCLSFNATLVSQVMVLPQTFWGKCFLLRLLMPHQELA
jgi:hypothetical protein